MEINELFGHFQVEFPNHKVITNRLKFKKKIMELYGIAQYKVSTGTTLRNKLVFQGLRWRYPPNERVVKE